MNVLISGISPGIGFSLTRHYLQQQVPARGINMDSGSFITVRDI